MIQTKVLFAACAVSSMLLVSACGSNGGGGEGGGIPGTPGGPGFKPADPLPLGLLNDVIEQGVPEDVATVGFAHYELHRNSIRNGRYVSLIDFTQHSSRARLYVVNVATGQVDSMHVAHGANSDPNNDGLANKFSNVPNSRKSSLGSYLISEKYYGKYGDSLKTDGLDSTNSLVRARTIVVHPSKYVKAGKAKQGRSWGCPAIPYEWIGKVIERLRDGSFMYAYSTYAATSSWDDLEIERIMLDPGYKWINESEAAPVDGE